MKTNLNFKMASSLAALVALVLSCTVGSAPATPTAVPTDPPPTATLAPPTATRLPPTKIPAPIETATLSPKELLPLSPDIYEHPSGVFSIRLPQGWKALDYTNSMFAAPTDDYLFMDAAFENVGVEFDDTMLVTYMTASNTSWWGHLKDYNPNAPEALSDGFWVIVSYALGDDDTPMALVSYYWRVGTSIFTADFGCPVDQYDAYLPVFGTLVNSLKVNAELAATAPLYQTRKIYSGPKDLFQLGYPAAWTHVHNESDDGTTVLDTFSAPSGNSAILSIGFDNGTPITKSQSGQFALFLLHDVIKIEDIKVTSDQVQADGSERLIWTTPVLDGVSFFETRGTTFLMLSWFADTGYYDLFFPLWEEILATYTIP